MLDYRYVYFLISFLFFLPLWVYFYIKRKDLRHKMIGLSFVIGIAGLISEVWYIQDYWHPLTVTGWPIGFEDFFFGFVIGGIGSVIYEELFGKRYSKRKSRKHHWMFLAIIISIVAFGSFSMLFYLLKINSIYASDFTFLITSVFMLVFRKDLLTDSLASGFLCCIILLLTYIVLLQIFPQMFVRLWYLKNLSGVFVYKIPIEEFLWTFGWGMVIGPFYEFYAGLKLVKMKNK